MGLPPRGPGAIGTGEWIRVWRLADVENLYDLGFWDNLKDVFWPMYDFRQNTVESSSRPNSTSPLLSDVVTQG